MISLIVILMLIAVHFLADFVAQTRWMGINKSSNNLILLVHVSVYTMFLVPFGLRFALLNGLLHFITDYYSSRASNHYYKEDDMYGFWTVIGLDQAIHMACLFTTYVWLLT